MWKWNWLDSTECNRGALKRLWFEEQNERDALLHTTILLIQSGHTFLQIILLIILTRSITALNQTELWVHSLCLCLSISAGLCDSHREHNLTPVILSLSFLHPLFSTSCASASPQVNQASLQYCPLPWFSLSLISIFNSSNVFFLIKFCLHANSPLVFHL